MYNRYIRGDGGTYTRAAASAPAATSASGRSAASWAAGSTACARAAAR